MTQIVINDEMRAKIVHELAKKTSSIKNSNAFTNPKDGYIYVTSAKEPVFWKENRIAHAGALGQFVKDIQMFGSMSDNEIYDKVNVYTPQFQALAEDYYKWALTADTSGIQVPENFTAIEVTNLLAQVRNENDNPTVLQDIGSTENVDQLEGTIPIETGVNATVGVARGATIPSSMTQYTTVPYNLLLIGVHIAKDWELNMGNLAFDPYKRSIKRASQAITTAIATRNKDKLTAATITETGSAWDSASGGASTNNPILVDIGPASDTIFTAQGNPKQMAMNDPVFRALDTNTWISGKGVGSNSSSTTPKLGQPKRVVFKDTGLEIFVDPIYPTDEAIVLDPEGFVKFNGPDGVLTYEDVHTRSEGYYTLKYFESKIIEASKVVKITNTLA